MVAIRFLVVTIAFGAWAVSATAQDGGGEIVTSHGFSTFGDLRYPADFEHFDYVNPDAPKGGEFSTWAFGTFDSINPYILRGNPAFGAGVLHDTLMVGSADEPDSIYGLIAETIEYPEDRSWTIFTLREEARFNDGSPITADDVVFSFETLVELGRPVYQVTFADVESVEALGPRRVRFDFREGAATRELPSLVGSLPVFSRAYGEETGRSFDEPGLEPWLGSSAYLLGEADPGRSVTYLRNEDYWAADLPVNVGQDNFDTVRYEYYADYTAAFEGFRAGVYNFREEFSSQVWGTGYDYPAINEGWQIREQIEDGTPSGTQGFWFNLRRPEFEDPRVREAIAMMFNFEWSNRTLFYDLYRRTDSFWENSPLEAEGMPSEAELALLEPIREFIPETVFTEPAFVPPVSGAERLDRQRLREANRLLEAAGFPVMDGVRMTPWGEPFTINLLNDVPAFERIINPYVENLSRLGIEVTAPTVDNAQAQERERNYDFDMVTRRYRMQLTPGPSLNTLFGSRAAATQDSPNVAGVANEGVDALLRNIQEAQTREDLNTAISALDRVLRAMHIWVPHWTNPTHNIAYLDVFDRPAIKPPYSRGTETWWWDEERAEALRAEGRL